MGRTILFVLFLFGSKVNGNARLNFCFFAVVKLVFQLSRGWIKLKSIITSPKKAIKSSYRRSRQLSNLKIRRFCFHRFWRRHRHRLSPIVDSSSTFRRRNRMSTELTARTWRHEDKDWPERQNSFQSNLRVFSQT